MEDLDVRLHAALHGAADGGWPDDGPPEDLRHRVVAGVRARRARRARTAGTLAAVVVAAVVVTSVAVSRTGGPTREAGPAVPVLHPALGAPPSARPGAAAEGGQATAAAPTTTGPAHYGPVPTCVTVSVGGGPAVCAGGPGQTGFAPTSIPTAVALGQTVVVSVPPADGTGPVTVTGTALRSEGADRFVAVAPGRSTLSLSGPVPWTVTVEVS